jgi:hypothetical protein
MRELKTNFGNLKKRWESDTPRFFKNVIKIGITIGGVGLAIPTLPFAVPAVLIAAASKMVVVGTTAAIVAKFAKLQ